MFTYPLTNHPIHELHIIKLALRLVTKPFSLTCLGFRRLQYQAQLRHFL